MKKILITGAAGFIGSHIVDYLLKDGESKNSLRLLIAPWDTLDNIQRKDLEIVIADIRNKKELEKAVQDVEVIYHLASKVGYDGGTYDYFKDTIVDGTKNILELGRKNKVKKIIFFSSTAVYGLPASSGNISGYSEDHPKTYGEGYGQSKLEAEGAIIKASKIWGLSYIILRPTTVFGPRDNGGMTQLIKAIKRKYFFFIGNGANKMDYIYIDNVVRVARTLEKSKIINEDYIVGSTKVLTQKQIVTVIARNLHLPVPTIYISFLIVFPFSFLTKFIWKAVGRKPIFFPNRVKVLSSDFYFDTRKIGKIYDKNEIPFEQGIKKTIKWLINEKNLL